MLVQFYNTTLLTPFQMILVLLPSLLTYFVLIHLYHAALNICPFPSFDFSVRKAMPFTLVAGITLGWHFPLTTLRWNSKLRVTVYGIDF